jgi:bile acid acyltransferase/acyl-CoA thioester hydrolase-like protein
MIEPSRYVTLARIEGMQDDLLFQGGTTQADAEAGVDAWRRLLTFLDAATKARGS